MEDFEMKLILEVESHRCLYDKTCSEYKNRYKKTESWNLISTVLNKPGLECQKKWSNLRDTFNRNLKQESNITSGSAASKNKKWKYFDVMKFIIPFISIPSTTSNFSSNFSSPQNDVDNSIDFEQPINNPDTTDSIINSEHEQSTPIISKRKRKTDDVNKILNAIDNINVEPDSPPLKKFFSSLAAQAENLTRAQQMALQIGCLETLKNIEFENNDHNYTRN